MNLSNEYYGDNVRWFIGKARNVTGDPKRIGRIQVRIFGLHTDDTTLIEDRDLPWAQVSLATNIPNSNIRYQGHGINDNDTVFGIFLDGKLSQQPLILGTLVHTATIENTLLSPSDIPGIPNYTNPANFELNSSNVLTSNNQFTITPSGATIDDIPQPIGGTVRKDGDKFAGYNLPKSITDKYTEIAYQFFVSELQKRGSSYAKEQAAGIVGNFLAESGMNPTIKAGGGEDSWGIAQWRNNKYNRFQNLTRYAQSINLEWSTLEPQLQYVFIEFDRNDIWGPGPDGTINTNKYIQKPTIEEATRFFLDSFENPNVVSNFYKSSNPSITDKRAYESEYGKRLNFARGVYQSFG